MPHTCSLVGLHAVKNIAGALGDSSNVGGAAEAADLSFLKDVKGTVSKLLISACR